MMDVTFCLTCLEERSGITDTVDFVNSMFDNKQYDTFTATEAHEVPRKTHTDIS